MWLNKDQIKNGLYVKVENQDKNENILKFQIDIMKYDYIELDTNNFFIKYLKLNNCFNSTNILISNQSIIR